MRFACLTLSFLLFLLITFINPKQLAAQESNSVQKNGKNTLPEISKKIGKEAINEMFRIYPIADWAPARVADARISFVKSGPDYSFDFVYKGYNKWGVRKVDLLLQVNESVLTNPAKIFEMWTNISWQITSVNDGEYSSFNEFLRTIKNAKMGDPVALGKLQAIANDNLKLLKSDLYLIEAVDNEKLEKVLMSNLEALYEYYKRQYEQEKSKPSEVSLILSKNDRAERIFREKCIGFLLGL
jgi:hypothetical protein